MEHYNEIRKKAFALSHEALMKSMDDKELLRAVARLNADPSFSFGLIRGLKQKQVAQWQAFVVEGKWRVKESYYCHEESIRRYKSYLNPTDAPRLVIPESYKAWKELRAKYPKGFDFYPDGRKAWQEYEDKYPDFWAESRLFDGRAHLRFGKIRIAPNKVFYSDGGYKTTEHPWIEEDELFLVLDVEADANTQREEYKDVPGICFVLTPNLESFEERRMALLNQFKAHVINCYLRKVMKHYDDCYAEKYKEEILEISDMVMAGTFDMEKEETEDE